MLNKLCKPDFEVVKSLCAKLCFGRVLKCSLNPNRVFCHFNLNCRLHRISVGNPPEQMSNF